jgi:hypothetical protein
MGMGRKCAYCDATANLTNEHVVPDFYHRAFGETISTVKTQTEDKAISNPREIGDVCANCNNVALSRLDSYLAALADRYFSTIVHPGDCVRFEYDFDLLLRVLLKVAHNVARTRNWPITVFQEAREFILGKKHLPQGFRIFLQLLTPTPVRKAHLPVTPGTTEVPPLRRADLYDVSGFFGIRIRRFAVVPVLSLFRAARGCEGARNARKRSIARWLKQNNGATELTDKGGATVYASSVTVLDAIKGNPTFETQLARREDLKPR